MSTIEELADDLRNAADGFAVNDVAVETTPLAHGVHRRIVAPVRHEAIGGEDVEATMTIGVRPDGKIRVRVAIDAGNVSAATKAGIGPFTRQFVCEPHAGQVVAGLDEHGWELVEFASRASRLADVLAEYEPDDDCVHEFEKRGAVIERFALVQHDHNGRHWVTTHESPEAASAYIDGEEIPWCTVELRDLETGDPFHETVRRAWHRPGAAPEVVEAFAFVTSHLLRETAIRYERNLAERAGEEWPDADDVKPETIEAVRTWWVDVIEGAGEDWDRYGETFVTLLTDGFAFQQKVNPG